MSLEQFFDITYKFKVDRNLLEHIDKEFILNSDNIQIITNNENTHENIIFKNYISEDLSEEDNKYIVPVYHFVENKIIECRKYYYGEGFLKIRKNNSDILFLEKAAQEEYICLRCFTAPKY